MAGRFTEFTVSVSKLNKLIQKLKTDGMRQLFDLKAVDTLCLYQLMRAPEGMLFSQMKESCDLDGALVSRTLKDLVAGGMVRKDGEPGKYNAKYFLTEKGREKAARMEDVIDGIQEFVDDGISKEELEIFYSVLGRLTENFEKLAETRRWEQK